ncbi:hypothetical protein ACFQV8_32635 [Pseudonocardia benzenivorans]
MQEVVHTHLNEAGDRLVVEFWHPGRGCAASNANEPRAGAFPGPG